MWTKENNRQENLFRMYPQYNISIPLSRASGHLMNCPLPLDLDLDWCHYTGVVGIQPHA